MSLSFTELEALCQEIKPKLEGGLFLDCKGIDSYRFILTFKHLGVYHRMLLCFQEPYLRFHLTSEKVSAKSSSFSEKISNLLKDHTLHKMELLNEDRILSLSFQKADSQYLLIGEFFSKSSNLYLADSQMLIQASLFPNSRTHYHPPAKPNPSPLTKDEKKLYPISSLLAEKLYAEKEKKALFQQKKCQLYKETERHLKRRQKQKDTWLKELQICSEWQAIQHEGLLLQANLYRCSKGMTEITLSDWEKDGSEVSISLNPQLEPYEEASYRFRKSQKLRQGIEPRAKLLKKIETELEDIQQKLSFISECQNLQELEKFIPEPSSEKPLKPIDKSLPFHEFETSSGLKLWAGKNAKANEKLTFSFAKGSDWWLHTRDFPGSHIILRTQKGQDPDSESLQEALQVAIAYSQAKNKGEADICLTQCKYVSRFGKKTGQVHISKHKVIHAIFDKEKFGKVKKNKPIPQ